jgi:hypothetical protein
MRKQQVLEKSWVRWTGADQRLLAWNENQGISPMFGVRILEERIPGSKE